MRYPYRFNNSKGNDVARVTKYKSVDGTPRYNINPKCPENTYTLKECLKSWNPIYKYKKGDIVLWKEKGYILEIVQVKVKLELVRCKGYSHQEYKTISWLHWLDFSDLKLLNNE